MSVERQALEEPETVLPLGCQSFDGVESTF
jgi:hypothetical protein